MTLHQNYIEIPITRQALATAEQFAAQQPQVQQQEQIRLNTLAVWAVRDYLELMSIATELDNGDSWNPILRLCEDVADLTVTGLGKLECRPLVPDLVKDRVCLLPPEVCSDRLGYIVVEIDIEHKKATLLGFAATVANEQLPLNELQPLTDLFPHLASLNKSQVNLAQWFDNLISPEWQTIEAIFATEPESTNTSESGKESSNLSGWLENISDRSKQIWQDLSGSEERELQPAVAFRSPTKINSLLPECELMRGKLIDLGVQLGSQAVVLLLALTPESDNKLRLVVQLYPQVGENYLPANLKLALLTGSGDLLQSVNTRTQDRGIQLKPFKILRDTNFQLQITLNNLSLTETFSF